MYRDLTKGNITKTIIIFVLPMMAGNLLQQFYNIADTLIVGRFLGRDALAAVGSAYTLMTFLTSVLLGLSMGAGASFSIYCGKGDLKRLRVAVLHAFGLIFAITIVLNVTVYLCIDPIMGFLNVPVEVYALMREYLWIIFVGTGAIFLCNFFSCLLRGMGNSAVPLIFLGVSAVLNIVLDLLFVLAFHWGVGGAAAATVIAQYVSGIGIAVYTFWRCREVCPGRFDLEWNKGILGEICSLSILTCVQQSVMNFGILMVQGLVNSFGPVIMAAFAAAVKIDSFAYMPVQDFGNAFSTFVAQNYGAGKEERIRTGIKKSVRITILFCVLVSTVVVVFARPLMLIFVQPHETEILAAGVRYLRVVGIFYSGIGCLFLLYGLYRAVKRPGMSVVLTVISLGTRVALAYLLSNYIGVIGIWVSIPVGWILADLTGLLYYWRRKSTLIKI
ncbi:MATE family efflux transporter [Ruminococcus sp. OA3]|uniref:MATE family efflux transporter n=1 Tax=Ruminococcus sp. OA3 TaxID=2914164 RepID=UPI001F051C5F|nr:MATE family efflux transporter [Ruminococcus sp. OA3]MCH1981411.1 MATE family efflux transporter [Ruminococcus sp. OA3]